MPLVVSGVVSGSGIAISHADLTETNRKTGYVLRIKVNPSLLTQTFDVAESS